ncbi:class I SAM-dependent methyltransferase, partial [Paenibacillus macerans]|nr:class I SAM-dependent methyltransferase [Paenibacillus macerans]
MTVPASSILSALLMLFVLLAMLSIVYKSWRNGISPMPASAEVRRAVAAELNRLTGAAGGRYPKGGRMPTDGRNPSGAEPASPDSAFSIVEAGSGWGPLALHLAKRGPAWRITGIDPSLVRWCGFAAGSAFARLLDPRVAPAG